MPVALPISIQRGFALLLTLALLMAALVPFVAPSPTRAASSDLFISEYVEGSSFNKAIEIYNGTGASVDLAAAGYSLELYSNGASTASQTMALDGVIADGDVLVVAHASATSAILAVADATNSAVINFNGDDAVVLKRGDLVLDVFGQIGVDPGTGWGSGDVTTVDHTLVRRPSVTDGDPDGSDAFDPAIEWIGYPNSTFSFLGSHSVGATPTDPAGSGSADPATVTAGSTTTLQVQVIGGTNPDSTGLAVSADLTPIGGAADQAFADVGGNAFAYTATVNATTPPGGKVITATVVDDQGRHATVEIDLTVVAAPDGEVVISQIYGGGGNSGATLRNDFVELFNPSTESVSLAGWSVQYASATGTSWQVTPLTGSIAPGGYYLVQQAAGSGGSVSLPAADATGTISMSATNGKVALVGGTTALVGSCPIDATADLVGFGTANCFEGTAAAPGLSNTTAALRADDGCTDTGDNAADISEGSPSPRNSASPVNPCDGAADAAPFVVSTSPSDGSVGVENDATISVTFSEPVDVDAGWFEITCTISGTHTAVVSGGPATYALDPDTAFTSGDACSVTIVGSEVTDQDAEDPPDAMAADVTIGFSVGAVCGTATHFIHEVQGSGAASPLDGQTVSIEGVVVGDYQGFDGLGGFFLQEEDGDADGDPATSDGIFVFDGPGAVEVAAGDVVFVTGTVDEFFDLTEITSVEHVAVCDAGATVTPAEPALPVVERTDLEPFEGMLVEFEQELTVTENFNLGRFGELVLSATGRQWQGTHLAAPGDEARAISEANLLARIILDDGSDDENPDPLIHPAGGLSAANTVRTGATVEGLTGVMGFSFGSYRVHPVAPVAFDGAADRPATPPSVGGDVQVAAFNVLNYFNGNGDGTGFPTSRGALSLSDFVRQHDKIVAAISAMDAEVVGLMEIENDGDTAIPAVETLVDGLNAELGAGTYDFIVTGPVGTDVIAVAIIYQPDEVTPLGDFAVLDSSVDPRFDEDHNRAALAQTFVENATGAAFTVAVNHLKSKGSPCGAGDDVPDYLGGNCNLTRTLAAQALVDWLASDPTGSGDPDALIIGDLNSYAMEDPIVELEAGGYTDLLEAYHGSEAYTYVFQGASGYLDHGLSSETLTSQVSGAAPWHINADEPRALEYSTEFGSDSQDELFYAPDAFRSSDHDPVLIGLDLALHDPTISSLEVSGEPAAVGETVSLSATFTDVDGGETHTAVVDWGDGTASEAVVDDATDSLTASHAYAVAGIHTVTLTLTDSGGRVATATYAFVEVYDPAAGFVTGGGRIDTGDGPGSFGISVNYEPGAETPEGEIAFDLPAFGLESTEFEWLIVEGPSAWIRGTATLDGEDGYAFLVAVTDAPDQLRLRVWDAATGEVVFDNQPGDPEDAAASVPIRNGQIKVHLGRGPAAAAARHLRRS